MESLTSLVERARNGERDAWSSLVTRLERVVWKTTYAFDVSSYEREEAFQNVWLRLLEHLGSIVDPERLPGWLATTTRNEVLALLRRQRRLVPTDQAIEPNLPPNAPAEERLMDSELLEAVRAGFRRLQPVCQRLLRLLTTDPPLSYAEISALLDTTVGYIGPTRQRCLRSLRATPELRPFIEQADIR